MTYARRFSDGLQYPELGQYFAEQARVWAERKRLGLEE